MSSIKELIRILLVVSIPIVLLFSCSKEHEEVFRIPLRYMPETFDPITSNDYYTGIINGNIFETLIKLESGKPSSMLAEYWFSSSDSLVVVKIRNNVFFSDGSLMTMDDVVKSLQRALDNPNSIIKTAISVDSLVAKDSNILYIHYRPTGDIINFLHRTAIYKSNYLDNFDDVFLKHNPLSTGEYYLYAYQPEKIVLKKNKFHRNYKKNKKSPSTVEIVYENSLESQYAMLKNNEVDFLLYVPLSDYEHVINDSNLNVVESESRVVIYLMLDTTSDISPGINLPTNPLKDKRVRKAIAHAVDTRSFITDKLHNKANILTIPSLDDVKGYPNHLEYYEHDVTYSKSLMNEAGLSKGFDMKLRITDGKFSLALADYVKTSLQDISINVAVEVYKSDEFYSSLTTNPASAYIASYAQLFTNLPEAMHLFFNNSDTATGRLNKLQNYHPHINALIDSLRTLDENDLNYNYVAQKLTNLIYDEAIVIPFFQPYDMIAHNNAFTYAHSDAISFSKVQRKGNRQGSDETKKYTRLKNVEYVESVSIRPR